MRVVAVIIVWLGCGFIGAAGHNAWTQRNYDLGCGSKARKENMARTLLLVPGGPINLFVSFLMTGFFDEGISFRWCPEQRFCQCDER